MAYYDYKVKKNGIVTRGCKEGTLSDLRKAFIDDGYIILDLREARERERKDSFRPSGASSLLRDLFTFRRQVRSRKLAEFSSQFSVLLDAGMTIPECISLMVNNEKDPGFKAILQNIEKEIDQGISLSESIKNRGSLFPPIFVMLIRTGEYSGQVAPIFKELAEYFEKIDDNKSRIIGVCTYPAVLTVFLLINLIVMSVKVVPVFREVFSDYQEELPLLTRVMFALADLIKDGWFLMVLIAVALPVLVILSLRNAAVKKILDRVLLMVPVTGKLLVDSSINSFLKGLALLLKNGMTIVQALDPAINIVGNHVIRESLYRDTLAIIEGKPLHQLLQDNKYINDVTKTLIKTGESSAKFDITLDKAIIYYNREINRKVDRINRLMEPALILVFGAIIGLVVISLAIPIFKISSGSLAG